MGNWFYKLVAVALIALNVVAVLINQGFLDSVSFSVSQKFYPRAYLARQCKEPDCDFALLDSIAWCESKWQMVGNPTSTAFGYFQILDGTERTTPQYVVGGSKYNPSDNIDMGVFLYERDSWYPWLSSRPCWHWRYQGASYTAVQMCIGAECRG